MDSKTLRSPIDSLNPSKPICVEKGTPVREVIKIMQKNRFGCVFVVDTGNLIGVFTERDVLTKVVGGDLDEELTRIEEVMTSNPEYLFVDDQVAYALNRMHVGGFRHVPLINLQGEPTGVISIRDILDFIVDNLISPN